MALRRFRAQVVADQLALAGVVAGGAGRVANSEPSAPATGYIPDESSVSASRDVSPRVTEGAISVTASDVTAVSIGPVISPRADAPHVDTMTTTVNKGQRSATDGLRVECVHAEQRAVVPS
jgi:hypothetical protein